MKRRGINLVMTALWLVMSAQALAISGYDETEFMTVEAFLSQVYGEPLPGMSLLPLRGDLRDQVETALGHRYRGLRLRYWQQGNVTTWIIDEKSKDMPMTLAVAVGPAGITYLNVLVYREPRGGEVHQAFFRQQFVGMTLQDDLSLSREVDGITGATLSVDAVSRVAAMALLLHQHVIASQAEPATD